MKKRQAKKNRKKLIGSIGVVKDGDYHAYRIGTVVEVKRFTNEFPESVYCYSITYDFEQVVDIKDIKIIRHGGM